MPTFAEGDVVLVPAVALGLADDGPALRERTVLAVEERSVRVDGAAGQTVKIGVARVHKDFGLGLLRVGDIESELGLLDPLASSLEQYFRLLLPDDRMWIWRLRTVAELKLYWSANHGALTHVVLVGHGSKTSLKFVDGWVLGSNLAAELTQAAPGGSAKAFISLACNTGYAGFGKSFSEAGCCAWLAAPFQAVHGAVALQYAETYFSSLLLAGSKPGRARRRAQAALPGRNHFVEWRNGARVVPDPTDGLVAEGAVVE